MKVAALVHFSMPFRNAGSESVLHELMKAAVQAGHEAVVFCTHRDAQRMWRGNEPTTKLDGVKIVRCRNQLVAGQMVGRFGADVVVTHHQHASHAIKVAKLLKARSVLTIHNDMDINRRPILNRPDLVIYNSDWVKESLLRFGEPKDSLVFHPPLTPQRHKTNRRGRAITLVNLNRDKGADLFYSLAKAEPKRQFIGVVGGHGPQIIRRLNNVRIVQHGPDMKLVWGHTRTLLMPSVYESYGLVAVEAGVNGIPTIAHPTPGLLENIGAGGLFADRDSISEWQHQLALLDDPDNYEQASKYALGRSEDAIKETATRLKEWTEWIG